ncbi:MAG: YfhO family protein [Chloroflexi bacterium]|nr:YfhO family protein [Chloroflexota bacterium]
MKVARLLIVPLLMGGLAFGMAAAQLIPTLELANASARGVGVDYGFATSYSFPPYNLVTLIWPYFFRDRSGAQWGLWANWETAVYVGILPLMLVVTGLVLRRNRQTVFWALVAVVSVWLAMAEYAPLNVHHWLYSLPVFNVLRAPARFLLVTDFALAVLAANGAHALLSGENASRRGRMSAVGLLLAAGALVIGAFSVAGLIGANREAATAWLDANYRALPNSGLLPAAKRLLDYAQWAVWLGNPRFAASVIALFAGALWLALAASRRLSYPLLRAITLLLVLGDLSYFASDFWQAVPVEAISQPEPVTQWLIAHTDGARVFSWPRSATQPDRLLRWGVPEAAGYSSLEIQRQSQILDAIQNSNNRLLDLSGAAWVVVPPRPTPEPSDAGATAPPRPYDPRAPLVNLVASSPSSQRTFVLSPPQTITSLHIVSALEHAPQVNQGDTVAQIIVTDTLGRAMRLPIRAGIESAEWALERPDIRGFARHRLAPVVFSFTANDDSSTPYTRHLYQADIPVGENTASIRAIELEVAARAGREVSWLVYALEAMTANGAPAWRAGRFDLLNFAPASESDRARIVRNQSALPRASLVYTGAVLADAPSLLARLTQPAFDPRAVLYLEEMPSGPALNLVGGQNRGPVPGGAERVSLVTLSDRHVQVQVDAPSDAFLLLTDTWYNGWAARDNGQPTKIYRADYLYRAVFVSAGPHQIDFTFEPESVRVGFMLTAATLVIAGMLVLAARQYDSSMAKRGRIRDREGK